MIRERRVKDIMLALSEYAVVSQKATLREALEALREAQKSVPPGRQPHRAVLVRDERGKIIGKLDHIAFLRALLPEREAFLDEHALERAGVSDDMRSSSLGVFDLIADDVIDVGKRVSHVLAGSACTSDTSCIDENASLYDAIKQLWTCRAQSLLVCRGSQTVGILRLSDLFDELVGQVPYSEDSQE